MTQKDLVPAMWEVQLTLPLGQKSLPLFHSLNFSLHSLSIAWSFFSSVVACRDCLRCDVVGEVQLANCTHWQDSLLCRPWSNMGWAGLLQFIKVLGIWEGCLQESQWPRKSFIFPNPFDTDLRQLITMSKLKLISKLLLGTIVRLSFRKLSKQTLDFKQVPQSHWAQ